MRPLDATAVAAWLGHFAAEVAAHEAELTELDRLIGDADHGSNLDRGMRAVAAIDAASCASARDYVKRAAMTLISTVGGAAGPLYGTLLLRLGGALPPDGPITHAQWTAALGAGVAGVAERGRAAARDKTMLDALLPAVEAFEAAAGDDADPFGAAAGAAAAGRDATVDLVARKGRASYLGERSRGVADPGATSAALLVASAAATLA